MLVLIDPATNEWVQLTDQVCLSGTIVALDNTSAFRKKRLGIFIGQFDEHFAPVLGKRPVNSSAISCGHPQS